MTEWAPPFSRLLARHVFVRDWQPAAEYRYEVLPNGEREYVYRTGLEFLGIPEDSRVLLDKYIHSLTG